MNLFNTLEQLNPSKDWAVDKKVTLVLGDKELTMEEIENDQWAISVPVEKEFGEKIVEFSETLEEAVPVTFNNFIKN